MLTPHISTSEGHSLPQSLRAQRVATLPRPPIRAAAIAAVISCRDPERSSGLRDYRAAEG